MLNPGDGGGGGGGGGGDGGDGGCGGGGGGGGGGGRRSSSSSSSSSSSRRRRSSSSSSSSSSSTAKTVGLPGDILIHWQGQRFCNRGGLKNLGFLASCSGLESRKRWQGQWICIFLWFWTK